MPKRKDDFRPKTISILGRRCGFICSNPACKRITEGPHSDTEKADSIGRACHIEAASVGGPRYNPNMTGEERRSINNGIWLCTTCASKIDSDANQYPVALLKQWKKEAEKAICLGNSTVDKVTYNGIKIIAVANIAGGVGKSFSSAALSYCLKQITKKNILCISVAQIDNAPMVLGIYPDMMDFAEHENKYVGNLDILNSSAGVDVISAYSIENNIKWQEVNYGTSSFLKILDELLERNKYSYIVCDCGRGDSPIRKDIILNATDVIVPIGENHNSYNGMAFIVNILRKNTGKKNMWVLHTMGLLANRHSRLFEEYLKIKEVASKLNMVRVQDFRKIVPYSDKVDGILSETGNLFEYEQIAELTEAYMQVAQELIESYE